MGENSSLGRQHVPDPLPDDEFTRDPKRLDRAPEH